MLCDVFGNTLPPTLGADGDVAINDRITDFFMARSLDTDFSSLEHRQIPMPAELMVPNSRRTPWKALVPPCSLFQRYLLTPDGKLSVGFFVYL